MNYFIEAPDKLAELKKKVFGGSAARRKIYNAISGTVTPQAPHEMKRVIERRRRSASGRSDDADGRTVVVGEKTLRQLIESYRFHTHTKPEDKPLVELLVSRLKC